jgi:hypothetical protein
MATAQQQSAFFSPEEAQRFAALWAGFETVNPSEAEAMGKGRVLRRMAAEKKLRLVDAFELPEIRRAFDAQLQPVRQPVPDVAAMQREIENLRRKLAVAVPKVRELAEELAEERSFSSLCLRILFGVAAALGTVYLAWEVFEKDWQVAAFAGLYVVFMALCFFIFKGDGFEGSFMNGLETLKEKALLCYTWASYIFFGLGVLTYLGCCIVAGGPVSPLAYIAFLYHCSQWKVS